MTNKEKQEIINNNESKNKSNFQNIKDDLEKSIKQLREENQQLKERIDIFEKDAVKIKEQITKSKKQKEKIEIKDANLTKRERNIIERENNAENNFNEQNKKALQQLEIDKIKLNKDIDELNSKLTEQKEVNRNIEIQKRKNIDKKLTKYFDNQISIFESKLDKAYKIYEAKKEKEYSDYLNVIEKDREISIIKKQEIEDKIGELKQAESKYIEKISNLSFEKEMLQEDRKNLSEIIEKKKNEIRIEFEQKLNQKDNRIENMESEIEQKEIIIEEFRNIEKKFGNENPQEILRKQKQLQQDNQRLKQEISKLPSNEIVGEYESLKKAFDELNGKYKELHLENSDLKNVKHKYIMTASEFENSKQQKDLADRRRETIEAQAQLLEEEVNKMRSLYEQPKEIEARIGVINKPYFKIKSNLKVPELKEIDWINNIYNNCISSGLRFNKRLLYAFHTALKTSEWSPITVLTGVSGTGKSELPRLYSRFGGLYFLPLPVQPDWDSPQSLFGFFNSIDNRFNATPLLRTLVQAQNSEENGLTNNVMLVLLDEMNLAYVELYFSELLSKLETRRGDSEGINLEIDLGAGLDKFEVDLSRNVLWTGTMNEDETTKSLSDKVLDRGNLISFPRPNKFERRLNLELADSVQKLPLDIWNSWLSNKIVFENEIDKFKIALEEINSYLENVGRALGHRVWQSVENYMANHPILIQSKTNAENNNYDKFMQLAFEDALVHKVMPKLRGIETDGESKTICLEPIANKISEVASGLNEDFQLAMTSSQGVFVWRSAKYLDNNYE